MASSSHFLLIIVTLISIFHHTTCRFLHLPSDAETDIYCNSWRLSVETDNAAANWTIDTQCYNYIGEYLFGKQYLSDTEFVASDSLAFAETVKMVGGGRDAWVFDIDETLLSNFVANGSQPNRSGSNIFQKKWKGENAEITEAPAINASLKLYNQVKELGFTIFLLTGRNESLREFTVENLKAVGYHGWKRLILRGPGDEDKLAIQYKSEKRLGLMFEGYKIHGNSGDQWSDLLGFAVAERSFKVPNPAYYIP